LLASNESKHPWMDEGFTSYISNIASNKILDKKLENPHTGSYNRYFKMISYRTEESLATHADRFHLNSSYSTASYSMGNIFLSQLEYIIGKENVQKGLKKYFTDFSFKHPTPNDVKRSMEKVSGIHLDWYLNEWTQTTHTIDYSVRSIRNKQIILQRHGKMPMPIDVRVTYKDGTLEDFTIPLQMMRGNKPTTATVLKDWSWSHPVYRFKVSKEISSVEIDPSKLMADIYPADNKK
jgi:aminopeptidase N